MNDPVLKAFAGKDAKTRRCYNAIFNMGFKGGARARVEAGITKPPCVLPRRSARVPEKYTKRDERALWSGGFRMGFAIGTPSRAARVTRR